MEITMCCAHSPIVGVAILKKIQDMGLLSEEEEYQFQMDCLSQVTEPADISGLSCYNKLQFLKKHIHTSRYLESRLETIHIKGLHIERFVADSQSLIDEEAMSWGK